MENPLVVSYFVYMFVLSIAVLLHLAEDNLPLDLSLGLSYLMALPQVLLT